LNLTPWVFRGRHTVGRYVFAPPSAKILLRLLHKISFICDNLLFSLGTARTTYLARLTESHQEITSTLAMGISINHIASMIIPAIVGLIWIVYGFEQVFLAAACLALAIAGISSLVPPKTHRDLHNTEATD